MLLRVRGSEGMARVECKPAETIASLKQQLAQQWKVPMETISLLRDPRAPAPLSDAQVVGALGLEQGAMLHAVFSVAPARKAEAPVEHVGLPDVQEDEVDVLLDSRDGWIKQVRDERTCFRHAVNGSCVHCMPVPPWAILSIDPWKKDGVKRNEGRGECRHTKQPGVFCQNCRPLTEESYATKKCDRHEPWPRGVCSYCKPDTIRITRQEYRHVDHVVFENTSVIASLIDSWRANGCQRGGFLFGRYVPHKDTPLGITCIVEAIYEPPQTNTPHGMQLQDDPREAEVVAHAKRLGLSMVGFAWTSIEVVAGKIIKSRDLDKTFLASSAEMLQAALFQNAHPSPCRHSMTGKYGSKWVSVLITGTEDGSIAPLVFQVSDQMAGMARDGIITTHAGGDPRLMQTVDNPAVYVPKVLYDDTNEYNRAVVKEATPTFPPLPFWVDVNFAAPVQPAPLLPTTTFPVENRPWAPQAATHLAQQLKLAKPVWEMFADFHLYLFLAHLLDKPTLDLVVTGLVKRDADALKEVLVRVRALVPDATPVKAPPASGASARPASSGTGSARPPTTTTTKPAAAAAGRHPEEAKWIASIREMGFDDANARRALAATQWSGVERAIEFLLNGN